MADDTRSETAEPRELSFNELVDGADVKIEQVYLEDLHGFVYIRSISAREREQWEKDAAAKYRDDDLIRTSYAALCLCDREGKPMVPDGQIEFLARKSTKTIETIFNAAIALNGVAPTSLETAKKV